MDLNESLALWPIRLTLPGVDGTTLWGSGGAERDVVLVRGVRVVLGASTKSLRSWVHRNSATTNLTALPNFAAIRRWVAPGGGPWRTDGRFDLRTLSKRIRTIGAANTQNLGSSGRLLDDLNLLWDIARCLPLEEVGPQMKRGQPLGALMDSLTRTAVNHDALRPPPQRQLDHIATGVHLAVATLSHRVEFVPTTR
jgi:hypothetical protein